MLLRVILVFSFCIVGLLLQGQDTNLANQYYQNGEYEKAGATYKILMERDPKKQYYFDQYVECMMAMEDFESAEKTIKQRLKTNPTQVQLYVTYGNLYNRQFQEEKAELMYLKAIDKMPADLGTISKLGDTFRRMTKFDEAIQVYEKGGKLMKNDQIFAYNLGNLYMSKGNISKMLHYHLSSATDNPNKLNHLKTTFQRSLKEESSYDTLKIQLYERIQDQPENPVYPELLQWAFVQGKEYDKALRQARSLDRSLNENGRRIFELARTASNDDDFDTAIKAYRYLIDEKGAQSVYYVDAHQKMLAAKRKKVIGQYDYTQGDIDSLDQEYKVFIEKFGINNQTGEMVKQYAEFLALYKNDLDGAIGLLKQIVEIRSINKNTVAKSKIGLADYYLMQNEIWESTLLYSQVDKDFEEEFLGELARFKNAKLSYYNGDFAWAQEQFDILKAATSRLISNDAIDLSVLIMDNMGLDTTTVPLHMYAQAELLAFQNKYDQAFAKLDSIGEVYPSHSLEDDVLYTKARFFTKLRQYDKAIEAYNKVIEIYPEEIRADNSIFELAELYETRFDEPEKAKELYEKLFIDFSNSTFAIEARKRYRILRGDNIQ